MWARTITTIVFLLPGSVAEVSAEPSTSSSRTATKRLDLATRSLARCCGKERATFGPLLGTLAIGALSDRTGDAVAAGKVPAYLRAERTGITINLRTGLGQDGLYLDGVDLEIDDHDLCTDVDKRLTKAWASRSPWVNTTRHVASKLDWTGPDMATATCTLRFERVATSDPSRCLADEQPNAFWEIDVGQRCMKPARPRGCMLDRETPTRRWFCSVDKQGTFWRTSGPFDERACTHDELARVDMYQLRECTPPSPPPASAPAPSTRPRAIQWRVYKKGAGCMAARMVDCIPSTTASIGRRGLGYSACKIPAAVRYPCLEDVVRDTPLMIESHDGRTCFVEGDEGRLVSCPTP